MGTNFCTQGGQKSSQFKIGGCKLIFQKQAKRAKRAKQAKTGKTGKTSKLGKKGKTGNEYDDGSLGHGLAGPPKYSTP